MAARVRAIAPPVRAGFTSRPVATSNVAWSWAREGARMERAIWTCTGALATRPHPLAPPLRVAERGKGGEVSPPMPPLLVLIVAVLATTYAGPIVRSEEHTSELQSLAYLVCRLLLEKKKKDIDLDDSHDVSGWASGAVARV